MLYHNNGDGTFTDVTERSGTCCTKGRAGERAAHFIDYDRDGQLDLVVSNYLEFDMQPGTQTWRECVLQLERHSRKLRPARLAARGRDCFITTTATARSLT